MTRPPSLTALPATLWPPPLIDSSRSCSRAKLTASTTSAAPVHCTISAGRRSISPFQIARAVVVARIARCQDDPANTFHEGLTRFRVERRFGRQLVCHRRPPSALKRRTTLESAFGYPSPVMWHARRSQSTAWRACPARPPYVAFYLQASSPTFGNKAVTRHPTERGFSFDASASSSTIPPFQDQMSWTGTPAR